MTRAQAWRVLAVFVPTFAFCLVTAILSAYVASFLLIAGFMRLVGRDRLVEVRFDSPSSSPRSVFVTFDIAFDVIMPKGAARSGLRLLAAGRVQTMEALGLLPARLCRLWAHLEDTGADDGRAGARHSRGRLARSAAPTALGDPAAADVHDGHFELGDRDAVLHLLGRAVRRRHHLDSSFNHPASGPGRVAITLTAIRWRSRAGRPKR